MYIMTHSLYSMCVYNDPFTVINVCIQLLGSGEGGQGSQWRVWQRDQGGQEERTAWVSVCVCVFPGVG